MSGKLKIEELEAGISGNLVLTGTDIYANGANLFVDVINEYTTDVGVTTEGVLLKDAVVYVDTINELTGAAGVTMEGVLLKDSNICNPIKIKFVADTGTLLFAYNGSAPTGVSDKFGHAPFILTEDTRLTGLKIFPDTTYNSITWELRKGDNSEGQLIESVVATIVAAGTIIPFDSVLSAGTYTLTSPVALTINIQHRATGSIIGASGANTTPVYIPIEVYGAPLTCITGLNCLPDIDTLPLPISFSGSCAISAAPVTSVDFINDVSTVTPTTSTSIWQSFPVSTSILLTTIDTATSFAASDAPLTMNIYTGTGLGGTLVATQTTGSLEIGGLDFPIASRNSYRFDWPNILLTAGTYTLQITGSPDIAWSADFSTFTYTSSVANREFIMRVTGTTSIPGSVNTLRITDLSSTKLFLEVELDDAIDDVLPSSRTITFDSANITHDVVCANIEVQTDKISPKTGGNVCINGNLVVTGTFPSSAGSYTATNGTSDPITLTSSDEYVFVDYTLTANVSVILPAISSFSESKKIYYIIDSGGMASTNNIEIFPNAADEINRTTSLLITQDNASISIVSNTVNGWFVF